MDNRGQTTRIKENVAALNPASDPERQLNSLLGQRLTLALQYQTEDRPIYQNLSTLSNRNLTNQSCRRRAKEGKQIVDRKRLQQLGKLRLTANERKCLVQCR